MSTYLCGPIIMPPQTIIIIGFRVMCSHKKSPVPVGTGLFSTDALYYFPVYGVLVSFSTAGRSSPIIVLSTSGEYSRG
jgi:hypothetical protein